MHAGAAIRATIEGMKLTILGCTGSLPGPEGPASGYLVEAERMPGLVMDMGSGVLAQLEQVANPSDVHVALTHLHPDHCSDFPSLMVWRRYHPTQPAAGRHLMFGPAHSEERLGAASADVYGEIDNMADTFAFEQFHDRQTQIVDRLRLTPFEVIHPTQTFALRVEEPATGVTVAYSADSAYTDALVECARGADLFLCEATWGATAQPEIPPMHLTGQEAGRIATEAGVKKLVLVHIPPWGDPEGALRGARETFAGPVELGRAGATYSL